ncbi:MAG: DUF86 domain-containing protein [Armatimonadota bacterium]|nr:DUF86 domain-containing protein [Armatimonadota bacterium]MDR7475809.1 DUF86 domain-containing protein [Armatimonadota bacterium]
MPDQMLTAEDVLARRPAVEGVLRQSDVRCAFLFGSAVDRDRLTPARDLDIAVQFRRYSFEAYLKLKERLSALLQIREDDLDLVVLDRVNARLKLQALLTGIPLFVADARDLDELTVGAFFEYEVYRRFRGEHAAASQKRLEEGLSVAAREVDRERVEGYLSRLDETVGRLAELRRRFSSFQEFEGNLDTRELCVHHLRIALECVLDVCRHFLAVKGVSLSEIDTTSLIDLAGQKGLIDSRFAQRIRGMAGLRDAIVHVYWRLDYRIIYEVVTARLGDLDEFAVQVRDRLGLRGSGPPRLQP